MATRTEVNANSRREFVGMMLLLAFFPIRIALALAAYKPPRHT